MVSLLSLGRALAGALVMAALSTGCTVQQPDTAPSGANEQTKILTGTWLRMKPSNVSRRISLSILKNLANDNLLGKTRSIGFVQQWLYFRHIDVSCPVNAQNETTLENFYRDQMSPPASLRLDVELVSNEMLFQPDNALHPKEMLRPDDVESLEKFIERMETKKSWENSFIFTEEKHDQLTQKTVFNFNSNNCLSTFANTTLPPDFVDVFSRRMHDVLLLI